MPYDYNTPAPAFSPDTLQSLQSNLTRLNERDQDFARSLLRSRSLTPKQQHWAAVLAHRATAPAAEQVDIGSFGGLIALFDKASEKLKHPAIVVDSPVGELRITVAGPRARCPGTVNVAQQGRFGEAYWYGRVDRDGVFTANKAGPTPPALIDFLKRLATDPEAVAAHHGKTTGRCCFCNTPLKDPRSTSVGYGPICASTYGLVWGGAATTLKVA